MGVSLASYTSGGDNMRRPEPGSLEKCMLFAEEFESLRVSFDYQGHYLVYIPHLDKKVGSMLHNLSGRVVTLQDACMDYAANCVGLLVYHPGESVCKRKEIVCIGLL